MTEQGPTGARGVKGDTGETGATGPPGKPDPAIAIEARALAHEARSLRAVLGQVVGFTVKRRRRDVLLLAAAVVMAIQSHDTHLDKCGIPSERQSAGQGVTRHICDMTFPSHGHRSDEGWPTPGNLVGLSGYLLLGSGAYLWYRRAPEPPA